MRKNEVIITIGTWLIVVIVTFLYVKFFPAMQSIGDAIVAASPALIFFAGGVLIFSRDQKIVKRTKQVQEYSKTINLDWGVALKHDLLTYFIPVLIIVIPFIFGGKPNLNDVLQAISAFLVLAYLKFTYWGEF
jgi:hypothetical protein